jgi:hypothetical protein
MDYEKLMLIGKSSSELLNEIQALRKWDNGHNYPIRVAINEDRTIKFDDNNVFRKYRHKPTNLTPKKKKRKK